MAERHCTLPPIIFLLLLILHFLPLSLQQQQKISSVDLNALISIKNSLTDIPFMRTGARFFSTWDFSSPDPCSSFSGLTCSLGRVTALTLGTGLSDSPGLAGSLSSALSDLSELTELVLNPGIVTGPIPQELGRLRNLRVISLTGNRLTGPIPSALSSLPNLHTLDLGHNQLTGSTPPGLTALPQLKILILASNELTGKLPNVSSRLLHLDLKSNRFIGRLPTSMPSSLRYLSLSENLLWGPLNGLESLSELVYLDLSVNHFTGPIPPSLFRPSLSSLLLQRNYLQGGVPLTRRPDPRDTPPSLTSSYVEGSIVDLSHNYLTGELSDILAGVESLFLNNNRLTGAVPEAYVKNVYDGSTKTLYLQHNYISGFPLEPGLQLPDTASLCLLYNCMVPPTELTACPATAGTELSRPAWQCSLLKNSSFSIP